MQSVLILHIAAVLINMIGKSDSIETKLKHPKQAAHELSVQIKKALAHKSAARAKATPKPTLKLSAGGNRWCVDTQKDCEEVCGGWWLLRAECGPIRCVGTELRQMESVVCLHHLILVEMVWLVSRSE